MISHRLDSPNEIADWLRSHLTIGYDLSYPYARKWEVGGCTAIHSLWSWPSDRVFDLASGLFSCNYPIVAANDGVLVSLPERALMVSADRTSPGEGLPDAYHLRDSDMPLPGYIGNSPEVVVEIVRGYTEPTPLLIKSDIIEIGFPGRPEADLTYVGSWEWDVHGEARGTEFVQRAAAATLKAINAGKARQ